MCIWLQKNKKDVAACRAVMQAMKIEVTAALLATVELAVLDVSISYMHMRLSRRYMTDTNSMEGTLQGARTAMTLVRLMAAAAYTINLEIRGSSLT